MAISFGGINTGLPPNLVDQLVEVEKMPIKSEQAKKAKTKTRLDLVTDLETKLRAITANIRDLANTGGFSDMKLITGDPNVIQGSVDPKAAMKGNWNIEVIDLPQKAAAISNGYPDKDKTEIGVGYFSFDTVDGTKEVYLSGKNSTLDAAAHAINNAGVGIQASVIKDSKTPEAPYKLMVSGAGVGEDNKVSYPHLYFLDGDQDLYFDETTEAKNGKIKVDGIEFEVSENQLKDVIPGVILDLKQATPGKTVNVSVKEDREVVGGKIKGFVDSMNAALGFIQGQNKLTEKSDTSSTLGGDGLLRSVESDLRRLIQDPIYGNGSIHLVNQLGIVFDRNGLLEFDQKKFDATLGTDSDNVRQFFVGDGFSTGFIAKMKSTIGNLTDGNFGALPQRKIGLENKMRDSDQRIETLERNLTRKEQSLRKQFANLETTMSKLKSQGSYLQQHLGGGGAEQLNFGGASLTG